MTRLIVLSLLAAHAFAAPIAGTPMLDHPMQTLGTQQVSEESTYPGCLAVSACHLHGHCIDYDTTKGNSTVNVCHKGMPLCDCNREHATYD